MFVATSKELLSTGTFVIGSDDRLPLLDNSPFMLKAKGKYAGKNHARSRQIGHWTSSDLAHKVLIHLCGRFIIVILTMEMSD